MPTLLEIIESQKNIKNNRNNQNNQVYRIWSCDNFIIDPNIIVQPDPIIIGQLEKNISFTPKIKKSKKFILKQNNTIYFNNNLNIDSKTNFKTNSKTNNITNIKTKLFDPNDPNDPNKSNYIFVDCLK